MELGLITLTEMTPDPVNGKVIDPRQLLQEIIDAAILDDQAGLDVFEVGKHHRADYAVSSPPVVLAAIAQATERIRLASGTALISTADPVRVYQDFATVDLLSAGHAEIIVGRGAFTESFPLFGYNLDEYDALVAKHLALLLEINSHERVTWHGRFRSPPRDAEITPRADLDRLPIGRRDLQAVGERALDPVAGHHFYSCTGPSVGPPRHQSASRSDPRASGGIPVLGARPPYQSGMAQVSRRRRGHGHGGRPQGARPRRVSRGSMRRGVRRSSLTGAAARRCRSCAGPRRAGRAPRARGR